MDATACGRHLAQVPVRDASPTRSRCSAASPAARVPVAEQITTGDASGDLGDPGGTCSPPRGVAGAQGWGRPPPCIPKTSPSSEADSGAAPATAMPARSIRRAASPLPGPRRAPGPHRTWAGSGTRNWTGCPPPPRPRAAGSSGPPWPLRSRRRLRRPSLSAPDGRTPGAGVGCPPRPARLRRCCG